MLRKNTTGQYVYFALINATTGAPVVSATVTGRRIIDGGTPGAITGTISDREANGFYEVALSQPDTNGNDIGYFFTASGAIPVGMTVLTTAANPADPIVTADVASIQNNAITASAIAVDAITSAKIEDGAITNAKIGDDAITASKVAAEVHEECADTVWNEVLSDHNLEGTAGQRLHAAHYGQFAAVDNTPGAMTVTLDSVGRSSANDFYNNMLLVIVDGNGAGQARTIEDYTSSGVASVSDWVDLPNTSSQYMLVPSSALANLTAGDIADAVWDELKSEHQASNTFGDIAPAIAAIDQSVDTLSSGLDGLVNDIWNEPLASHLLTGSTGEALDAIVTDTDELQAAWEDGGRLDLLVDQIITDIAALNDLSAAQVNAEVVDALATDTYAESSAVPAATATLAEKIRFLATLARNKQTQTDTTTTLRNDGDSANVGTSAVSDVAGTTTRGRWSS